MSYFTLCFIAHWNQRAHVPPSKDIRVQLATVKVKPTLTLACFHHNKMTFILRWAPSISTMFTDKSNEWFSMTSWWMRKEWDIKNKKPNKLHLHISTVLSLPVYRHVLLTLKFQCSILYIYITYLAKNSTIPYLDWEIHCLAPLNIKQRYFAVASRVSHQQNTWA